MVKYALYKEFTEIPYRKRREIKEGVVIFNFDNAHYPERLDLFDSKEEALKALSEHESDCRIRRGYSIDYYMVKEYYVREIKWDENHREWLSFENSEIVGVSQFAIELVDDESGDVLAVFDNFADAEDAEENYIYEGKEVHLN